MTKTLVGILTCLVAGTAIADSAEDVRCREIGFSKSAEQMDMDAFRSFIDDDARFVSSGVLRGVDQIADGWSVFFEPGLPSIRWRPQFIEVLESGELALSRGHYISVSTNAEGDAVEYWGTFNSVWRLNDDGVWRVVFDAGSPAPGSPDAETRAFMDEEDNCP